MRKVVVSEFVSLDGVIEDPGGSGESDRGGWSFRFDRGPEGDEFKFDELAAADARDHWRRYISGWTPWNHVRAAAALAAAAALTIALHFG